MKLVNTKIEKKGPYFWKGKRVTEKVFENRMRMTEVGKCLQERIRQKNNLLIPNQNSYSAQETIIPKGRRIINIEEIAKNLICSSCNEILSLQDIISEKRCGVAGLFDIQCRKCLFINNVVTDKVHETSNRKVHFDVNTKLTMGALHSGLGCTQVNKILASVNVPTINGKTFKRYEREVGPAAEAVAKESCRAAVQLERDLTVKNAEEIENLLPEHLKKGFIIPNDSNNVVENDTVRFSGSYDMGWSKRGTGRSYDSLNGQATLVGTQSGKIMGYTSKIRKCKKCDAGHQPTDHDCRLNYQGSAKGMEPVAAVDVTEKNEFLREFNMELGILVGDDDSSTILNVRNAANHEIVKHSDKNHLGKGVVNGLYKLQSKHKELTKESINSLSRSFNYAISQNKGNNDKMAIAIKNLPYHYFDQHEHCGDWCKYKGKTDFNGNDSEECNTVKKDVFKDSFLKQDLIKFFDNLASQTDRFAACASSQANESFNAILASKAPKSKCYSQSESLDYRLACAVGQKNIGEYIMKVSQKLQLSPGKNTQNHVKRVTKISKRRAKTIKQAEFKKRRLFLKKQRTQLRKKKEASEGRTYESNMGLITDSHEQDEANKLFHSVKANPDMPVDVILFDLETTSLSKNADILQIAASYDNSKFSVYVKPSQKISEKASEVTGLQSIEGNLLLNGNRVESFSPSAALRRFFIFLATLKIKCVLTAHNCAFDCPRLIYAIKQADMIDYFEAIVYGFSDTLPIIKRISGKTGKGENSLSGLANSLDISSDGAHNAINDVTMLEEILQKMNVTNDVIKESAQVWHAVMEKTVNDEKITTALKFLSPLQGCTTSVMRKKIAQAKITYEMIIEAFNTDGKDGIQKLFGKDESNNVRVTKSKSVIEKIITFLSSLS